jgi:hypothetical protein
MILKFIITAHECGILSFSHAEKYSAESAEHQKGYGGDLYGNDVNYAYKQFSC